MDTPYFVKYPKYLITAELITLDSLYRKFQGITADHKRGYISKKFPYIVNKDRETFLQQRSDYTFWEQRVLMGVLALFTVKDYVTNRIKTDWWSLYIACFLPFQKDKNNKYYFPQSGREYIKKALGSLTQKKILIPFFDKKVILNTDYRAILSLEESRGSLYITLALVNEYLLEEAQNNFNLVESNIFTFLKSGSKYSPRFIKWLRRQTANVVPIQREKLLISLGLGGYIRGKRYNFAKKTLCTAYQEAKDAGILLGWKEKDGKDIFYISERKEVKQLCC